MRETTKKYYANLSYIEKHEENCTRREYNGIDRCIIRQ